MLSIDIHLKVSLLKANVFVTYKFVILKKEIKLLKTYFLLMFLTSMCRATETNGARAYLKFISVTDRQSERVNRNNYLHF